MSKLRLRYSGSSLLSPVFLALILALVTPVAVAQSSSVFNGPRDYPVGSSPASVVIGDFNGDGRPDIATANSVSNDVSVLLQNSDGTFQAAVRYPVGNGPASLQVGDVNGDGKLDLVSVNSTDSTLGILLGNGDGTFQAQQLTTLPSGSLPYLIVGDFNGDGKADVALGEPLPQVGNYAVAVLLSNGDGTFQAPVTYPVNAAPEALAVGDFNNDGKPDIVSATTLVAGVSVLLGNGDGTFQTAVTSATSVTILGHSYPFGLVADFNGDGNLDIATATFSSDGGANVTLFLGNGDGTFRVDAVSLPALNSAGAPLAAGDLNGDGKPDLIAFGASPGVMILLNNGDGTFSEGPTLIFGSGPMALADLNNDQKLDLVAAVPNLSEALGQADIVSVLHGNGDGNFAQFPSYAVAVAATSGQTFAPSLAVVASDFDGNGKPDLAAPFVVPNETGLPQSVNLGLLLNNGGGFQSATTTVAQSGNLETGTAFVAAGDFNGDGKRDVAEAYTGSVSILLGNGDGTFQSAVQYGAGISGPIAVGDFNGDGKLDVVGVNAAISPGVSVLLGKGDGTFGFPVNSSTSSAVTGVTAADFNGDGKLDVAALTRTGAAVALQLLLGNGDGTFSTGATYNVGFNPTAIASGDLNGDGITDIIVGNSNGFDIVNQVDTPSSIVVLLGIGDGTFQTPVTTVMGNGISSIAIADFNRDGKADLAFSNTGWGDISLVLGNGDGTLQSPMEFFVGATHALQSPYIGELAVADFDGNGTPDLAVAAFGGVTGVNNIAVLLNAAGSNAPAALLSTGTLAFGSESVGQTTSAQTVTLSYMASTALTISGITITGAQSADFAQTNNCGASLVGGGNCTISVTFSPQAAGARTASIQITDNASNSPQTISLTGTGTAPPEIGLKIPSHGSSSASVAAGQPASYTLSIGGTGMSGTATLTCTGAPQGAVCSVPATATVSATAASSVEVSLTTTSDTMASVNSRGMIRFGGLWATLLLGVVLVPAARRKRAWSGLYLGAMVASLLLISSCGGGSSGPKINPNGTPAGTYQLTVTATLNSTTENVTLQLIVQ